MSAIWGAINLLNEPLPAGLADRMEEGFYKYRIDEYRREETPSAVMGCGVQFVTPEAKNEKLPIKDEKKSIIFTADVFLDNRENLIRQLYRDSKLSAKLPDGDILYAAYLRWGDRFTEYCLGAYTVAIFDYNECKFKLYTDHMNNRCIYYCVKDKVLYFSTIMEAIVKVCPAKHNMCWTAGAMATISPSIQLFEDMTPYERVYQLGAAKRLEAVSGQRIIHTYWEPEIPKKSPRFSKKEDYKGQVRDMVSLCVNSVLRSSGKTGCTLSSGLDSTTVACMAAATLKKTSKELRSYTSVPHPDYKSDKDAFYITDERPGVEAVCKQYDNIEPTFVDYPYKNALSELERLVPLIEYPSQSMQNLTWLDEIYSKASEDGCRIMLKGQYGNVTLSYGKVLTVVYQKLQELQFVKAYKILRAFCRKQKVSFKYGIKLFISLSKERNEPVVFTEDSLLKKDIIDKYKLEEVFQEINKIGGGEVDTWEERLRYLYDRLNLMTLSVFDTHFGLMYGLIIRDPLKDKRLVELCAKLPIECVVEGDVERAMARTYMKGIVPDAILEDRFHRGLQSADMMFRMRKDWPDWKDNILKVLDNEALEVFADIDELADIRRKVRESTQETVDEALIRKIGVLYPCSIYFGINSPL